MCAGGGRALEEEMSTMLLLLKEHTHTHISCAHVPWLAVYLPAVAASFVRASLSILSALRSGGCIIIADANNLNYFAF